MIWFKRVVPILVIVLAWLGYTVFTDYSRKHRAAYERSLALTTARIWIASAKYREDPNGYLAFRDSVLTANDFTLDEVRELKTRYESDPAEYEAVAAMVSDFVDSLFLLEDSLRRLTPDTTAPSASDRPAVTP